MNFEDLLKLHRIPIAPPSHHHARDGWVNFDCPFCHRSAGKFHMGYSTSSGGVSCWMCGRHSLARVLVALLKVNYKAAKEIIVELPKTTPHQRNHTGKLHIPEMQVDLMPQHKRYLTNRGYDPDELVRLWGLRGYGPCGGLVWRVWIPIHYYGEVVSWTARSIGRNNEHRYLSAKPHEEAISHSTLLYGMDYVRHVMIINEGAPDVWAIGPGAVATLGTALSRAQIKLMASVPTRVVCFDSSEAAQNRARELCEMLKQFPGETYNVKLTSKDAGDALLENPHELHQLRAKFFGLATS